MDDPSDRVRVEVVPSYEDMGVLLSHEISRAAWRDLGNLLFGRPGWYCHLSADYGELDLAWTFGPVDEALFVIDVRLQDASGSKLNPELDYSPEEVRVVMHVYDHEADTDHFFEIAASVESWLDANEQRHANRPRDLRALAEVNEWRALKGVGFDVDVDADGDTESIIATARKLPLTPAFGGTVKEALSSVRAAIAEAFGAPENVASEIAIRAHLTAAASATL